MSTDLPDEAPRGGTGRQRVGDSRSPVGSTLSIVLAAVAVIAGFFILREITDDDGDAGGGVATGRTDDGNVGTTTIAGGTTAVPGETATSSTIGKVTSGATVAVANASGIGGTAAQMSTALEAAGYELGEPGNSTGGTIEASIVHFVANDPAAQAVAQSVAVELGGVQVLPMPDPVPASGGDVATAGVLVMLGTDAAGKALAELSAPAIAPPAIAGQTTTSTTTG